METIEKYVARAAVDADAPPSDMHLLALLMGLVALAMLAAAILVNNPAAEYMTRLEQQHLEWVRTVEAEPAAPAESSQYATASSTRG